MVTLEPVTGAAIAPHLAAVAALRIAVFRDYPYLYLGSLDYERRYLAGYAASDACLVVLARDGDQIVGASTALPAGDALDDVTPALIRAGYPAATVCYFGESVLAPAYRGQGIGGGFFDHRERHARARGFTLAAFCAVARPDDHPRRPADYRPHDALWTRRGFVRRPDITTTFAWRDLDEPDETEKQMVFWIKELR